jgi:hypothetical protein
MVGMRARTLRFAEILGATLLFMALVLPLAMMPSGDQYSPLLLLSYILDGSMSVKIAALLLYLGAFLAVFTHRFQTFVIIGGVALVLLAADEVPLNIGVVFLVIGISLATVRLWWRAVAEAFEDDEEQAEQTEPAADDRI